MLPLLAALLAAACPLPLGLLGAAPNASADGTAAPRMPASEPPERAGPRAEDDAAAPSCNISVQRPMLSSLLVRWGRPRGWQCDLLLFSTNAHGRALFAAAFHRVGSPLLIEHLGLAAGGAQQDLRLCVGCGWVARPPIPGPRITPQLLEKGSVGKEPLLPLHNHNKYDY
nr:transmembrane protein 158 [Cavia porcellus]